MWSVEASRNEYIAEESWLHSFIIEQLLQAQNDSLIDFLVRASFLQSLLWNLHLNIFLNQFLLTLCLKLIQYLLYDYFGKLHFLCIQHLLVLVSCILDQLLLWEQVWLGRHLCFRARVQGFLSYETPLSFLIVYVRFLLYEVQIWSEESEFIEILGLFTVCQRVLIDIQESVGAF